MGEVKLISLKLKKGKSCNCKLVLKSTICVEKYRNQNRFRCTFQLKKESHIIMTYFVDRQDIMYRSDFPQPIFAVSFGLLTESRFMVIITVMCPFQITK